MRIAIVNDLPLAIEAVTRVVLNSAHQVAWIAHDGIEAVRLCTQDKPDLILMDLLMPAMDGVEATRRIMAGTPCPILVVTVDVARHSSKVFEAMGAGALDAINTPALAPPAAFSAANALLSKIEAIGKRISPAALAAFDAPRQRRAQTSRPTFPQGHQPDSLVVIGASAGGPIALARLLAEIPNDFSAPIIIVQHLDEQFAPDLAKWLSSHTPLDVRLAQQGDAPQPASVLLAGREDHLVLDCSGLLAYQRYPANHPYRPSIDILFKSVAQHWKTNIVGVLLTGMGRDGAEGLRLLRTRGHYTIAQDQATSAVYGMPRAAAELNAAIEILPLSAIGPCLGRLVLTKGKGHA
ncbi:MAG TPA: chemotaxis response regulator protein-glutamate methylesterase [Verrucomicrobiae bacterium]|nr:chemotaxis response regulator protein-glutamate methylesterase [Verrucomicrobiae bacterium]